MAILSDKGLTCSDPLCRQRDFLPFYCNKCEMVFCLEHYLPDSHSCPKKNIGDRRVYVCPACLDVVKLVDLETDDDAALRHRPQCKPELRDQRAKMRKGRTCPVKGCKERLTAISRIQCPHCKAEVCIKHRLKEDHNCDVLKASRKERRQSSIIRQLSASATRGFRARWHLNTSNSGGLPECSTSDSLGITNARLPSVEWTREVASDRMCTSLFDERCECDFAACWRPGDTSKNPKEQRNGPCTIM